MSDTEVATAKYVRKQLELYPPNKDTKLSVSDALKRIQDRHMTNRHTYDYEATLAIRELIKYIIANGMVDDFLIKEKKIEMDSSHGKVYIYRFKDSEIKIVIKKPRVDVVDPDNDDDMNILGIEREALIARDCLNPLRNLIPNFVNIYTYDNKSKKMYLEYVEGTSLYDELDNMSANEILQCIAQVSLALYMAQNTCNFAHYDLHTKNVMVNKLEKPHTITYPIRIDKNTIKYYSITSIYIARIFDLDSAYIRHDKRDVGYDFYGVGVYPDVFLPGSDLNKLLCFIHRFEPHVQKVINYIYKLPVDKRNQQILGKYCEYSTISVKRGFPDVLFTPPYVYVDRISQKLRGNWLTVYTKNTYKCTDPYYSVSWYLYGEYNITETVHKLVSKVLKYTERADIYYYMLMIYSCQLQKLKLLVTGSFDINLIKMAHDSLRFSQQELLSRKIPINKLSKLDNDELKRYMNCIGDTTDNKTVLYKQIYENAINERYWK